MFYIDYKDKNSGQIHRRYFNYQPNVKDTCCPKCKNRVMEQKWITHQIAEVEINYECLHCGTVYEEDDIEFVRVNNTGRLITNVDIYETYDEEAVSNNDYFCENDLGSIAIGLKNAKDKKVKITFDEKDMAVPVITPQPRSVRYTPEFLEKATKAMRDIPLKRQNIRVHEDDMESTCPACGYMLYEEANVIFNYCPTCGQALNNNDFSEDGDIVVLGEIKNFKITLTYTVTAKASDKVAALDSALHQVNNNLCLYTEAQVEEIEIPKSQKNII